MIHIQIPSLKCCFSERKWQFSVIDQWLPVFSSFVWLRIYLYGNPLFILPLNADFLIFFLSNCLKSNYLIVIEKCICFLACKIYRDTGCKQEKCQGAGCLFGAKFFLRREVLVMIMKSCFLPLVVKRKGKKAWVQEIKSRLLLWLFY